MKIDIRFTDTDAQKNVNHTAIVEWIAHARVKMLDRYAELSDINDLDHVLVSLNMNFSGKIFWPGEVEITGFVSEVGSKSVKTEFYVTDKDGTDLADAECVNVFFITYSGKSIIIPEEFKSLLLSGKISA